MADGVADIAGEGRRFPVSPARAAVLALLVIALLFAAYWFLLRTVYVPVFEGLSEADAAAVVTELDERKIAHRLAAGGTTILVAEGEADQARLSIASSELPLRGQIGFELFNDSDMGLTEFAQKINYQRALQGELARTIMLLDGVANARVHLALPERSLFRGARAAPTASVTLVLEPGHVITTGRILGIQRLIAGAVPEMATEAVVIVDDSGQLISASPSATAPPEAGGESDAVRQYYLARIRNAVAVAAPDLQTRIDLRLRQQTDIALNSEAAPTAEAAPVSTDAVPATPATTTAMALPASDDRGGRNYALIVTVTTPQSLSAPTRERLSQAAISAAELGRNRDDGLSFAVGPVLPTPEGYVPLPSQTTVVSRQPPEPVADRSGEPSWLIVAGAGVLAALLAALLTFLLLRRAGGGRPDPVDNFAEQLKARLAAEA